VDTFDEIYLGTTETKLMLRTMLRTRLTISVTYASTSEL